MSRPWELGSPLPPTVLAAVRRRAIFDHFKWDPQVGDVSVLADTPVLLDRRAWEEVAALAEKLAAETRAAEAELLRRPELYRRLGLPRPVRRVLAQARTKGAPPDGGRVIRFDFHYTTAGWRISEANSDVPGGFNESSGFTHLVAPHCAGAEPAGDPAESLADAVARSASGGVIALVHATAYTDDVQVMAYLGRHLETRGLKTVLVAPDNVVWRDGAAAVRVDGCIAPVGAIVRFFPAEWLPNLPRGTGWRHFFAGSQTPMCNPGAAVLTQTKRFPLVWDRLDSGLEAWRALLPDTRDPRDADWIRDPAWILKPALGRVGEGIGMQGVTDAKEWRQIARDARRHPDEWVAQRRFDEIPAPSARGPVYFCLGVYTVDGRAAGAYGRIAGQPLVNSAARDAAVLLVDRKSGEADHDG